MKISQGYMDKLLVNVKAGETTVLEIQTKQQGYVLDEKAQSASIEIELLEDKGSDESTPMTSSTVSVKLLKKDRKNKQNRQELIFQKVKDNLYRLDGIIPDEYFILVDNFPGNSESVECAKLNVTRGRIYESKIDLNLFDLHYYINRIEKKGENNPLKEAHYDGKFDSGVYRKSYLPIVPYILDCDTFAKLPKNKPIRVEQILCDGEIKNRGHMQILKVNISKKDINYKEGKNKDIDREIFLFGAENGKNTLKENGFDYTVKSGYQKLKIYLKKEDIGNIISRWESYKNIPSDSLELLIEVPSIGAVNTQGVFSVLKSIPKKGDNEEFPYNIKTFDYTTENFRCQIPIDDQSFYGRFVRVRALKNKVLDKEYQGRIKQLVDNEPKDAIFSQKLYPTEELFAEIFVYKDQDEQEMGKNMNDTIYESLINHNLNIRPGINQIFIHLDKKGRLKGYNIDGVYYKGDCIPLY